MGKIKSVTLYIEDGLIGKDTVKYKISKLMSLSVTIPSYPTFLAPEEDDTK
jgi:hypothetical protein